MNRKRWMVCLFAINTLDRKRQLIKYIYFIAYDSNLRLLSHLRPGVFYRSALDRTSVAAFLPAILPRTLVSADELPVLLSDADYSLFKLPHSSHDLFQQKYTNFLHCWRFRVFQRFCAFLRRSAGGIDGGDLHLRVFEKVLQQTDWVLTCVSDS